MEPDPTKNVEKSGLSRRRISSILKVPRKSVRYPDPEQQDNVVECAKQGEKRNSRRVSFAAANDVLLFSKDVKNTSPARSPFQDLTATEAGPTPNRGQAGDNGNRSQKIAGMESLLNAPLHDHQQKDKVNFDTRDDFGERTVLFSTHEASMDMTQSQTFNIASDADVLEDSAFQNNDVFPTVVDKRVMFPVDSLSADKAHSHSASVAGGSIFAFPGRRLDICVEKKNASASLRCLDPEFENFLAILNKPTGPSAGATVTRATPPLGPSAEDKDKENLVPPPVRAAIGKPLQNSRNSGLLPADPEKKVTDAPRGDEDVDAFQWLFPSQDMYANSGRRVSQTSEITKSDRQQTRKSVGLSDFKGMGTPYDTSSVDHLNGGEKTVRFTADDAAMDVTKSHTVNIATGFQPQLQNVDTPPTFGENIGTSYRQSRENTGPPDYKGMGTPYDTSQSVDHLNGGEKTVRFTADDAAMDVTKSHTVNIATGFQPQLQKIDTPPTFEEKTVRFSANDAGMDVTQCLTVNIATNSSSDSLPLQQNVLPVLQNLDIPITVEKEESDACVVHQERSVCVPEGELSKVEATDEPLAQECTDTRGSLIQPPMKKPDVNSELEAPVLASGVMEKSVNEIFTGCADISVNIDLTEAQTGHIMEQTFTNQTPQSVSLTQNQDFDHSKTVKTSPVRSEAPGPSCPDNVAIANLPDSPISGKRESFRESEPSSGYGPVSAVDQDADTVNSRKSRRISLADLTSKVRRLSHMINAAPDPATTESYTMPWSSLEHELGKSSEEKLSSAPVEAEFKRVQTEDISQDQCLTERVLAPIATPFSLKTKQLMSRLSVGGFKPKLPQRSKPEDSTKGKVAMTVPGGPAANVPNHLSNFDNDVSDIFDEELGSDEDTSEILDVHGHIEKVSEQKNAFEELDFRTMENDLFDEDFMSSVHREKRRFPEDEKIIDNEKRMKTTDAAEMGSLSDVVDDDSNVTAAPTTTQTIESSISSHTASMRCEATFESTYKQSFFESQLEDYASEMQMKLEDGTITVMEFFKIFNIDFVIHNPRQSVRPGRLLSETEVTAMDLLRNRHISRPKQSVYEADILDLTDKVERLKVRMEDLEKPLKAVNNPLWEEMRHYSEKELKSFGVKLKERNNFFRKTSKAQSHEMKGVLYKKLVQAHLEEQQKLKETIAKADDMLKSLDDCIRQLQTELAGVEENGFDGKPSIKSLQDEITKASETLADNERKIPELEMQKKQNSSKLKRLNVEIQNLESRVDVLEILNEWKLKERGNDCMLYTFLHETMTLQLTYEKSDGNLADSESERKTTEIRFSFELDDEKSQSHARLVHKLVSRFTEGESSWVEKFPTSGHVPKLLRDVGLVVSRCRLLGEECQRLKAWGSLPFDILHMSCDDTRICFVFSSLKAFSKFQVVFAVSLINRLCVLKVESFKNMIGSTTLEQIEEIVASFTPAQNLLTRIVKKIHQTLLC